MKKHEQEQFEKELPIISSDKLRTLAEKAIVERLFTKIEALEKVDMDERFTNIEKQMKYFVMVCTEINRGFQDGIKIKVDETAMNVINPLKETLELLRKEAKAFHELRKALQTDSVLGTLQYMAKQLTELTKQVSLIKEEGISKKVRLDLTMDGYEMVKKKAKCEEDDIPAQKIDPIAYTKALLDTLTDRERAVVVHRYGLFGEKEKTLVATAKVLKISGERVRGIQTKALRKMRHPSRKGLVENLTHLDLKIDIQGEES